MVTKRTDTAPTLLLMATNTSAIGRVAKGTNKAPLSGMMAIHILVSGVATKRTDKAPTLLPMATNTSAIGGVAKGTDKAPSSGLMAQNMLVSGKIINS